jgi:hypothetical protein
MIWRLCNFWNSLNSLNGERNKGLCAEYLAVPKKRGNYLKEVSYVGFSPLLKSKSQTSKKKRERQKYAALHCEVGVAPSV